MDHTLSKTLNWVPKQSSKYLHEYKTFQHSQGNMYCLWHQIKIARYAKKEETMTDNAKKKHNQLRSIKDGRINKQML